MGHKIAMVSDMEMSRGGGGRKSYCVGGRKGVKEGQSVDGEKEGLRD